MPLDCVTSVLVKDCVLLTPVHFCLSVGNCCGKGVRSGGEQREKRGQSTSQGPKDTRLGSRLPTTPIASCPKGGSNSPARSREKGGERRRKAVCGANPREHLVGPDPQELGDCQAQATHAAEA
jgi:hypothetical protein